MHHSAKLILLATLAIFPSSASAQLCQEWDAPQQVGAFDTALIPEASGIAASTLYAGRFYHNNDSGDGPYFYITKMDGSATKRITIAGFEPSDVEDIALGPCSGQDGVSASCIFIADIGDNAEARESVSLVQITESEHFGARGGSDFSKAVIAPLRIIEAQYPDGPHNAESIAIHPDGDLYLITKAGGFSAGTSTPAKIFMMRAAQLAIDTGDIQTFTRVGSLDLPEYITAETGERAVNNQVATGMDISADGTRTLIIAYRHMIEWGQDLSQLMTSTPEPEIGRNIRVTPLAQLPQSEAITYLPNVDAVLYSSEEPRGGGEAPIIRQICAKRGE